LGRTVRRAALIYCIERIGTGFMVKLIDMRDGRDSGIFEKLAGRGRPDDAGVMRAVGEIIADVREKGDRAVLEYTEKFDKVKLPEGGLKVGQEEWDEACGAIDRKLLDVIRKAIANIAGYHEKQKEKSWFDAKEDGTLLGQLIRPLEAVGIYVPGGTAPLISSVLMNAVPAKVAGVKKIIMATPPRKDGKIDPAVLTAAREAGVDQVYKMGGAQAIAAMAFGTQSVPKVDKILGPGNIYVATAKRMVYGYCDIDMFAGPSEIAIVADDSADPGFVAADMLSQAEHDALSSAVLITDSLKLAEETQRELIRQTEKLPRKDVIQKSLTEYGAIVIVRDKDQALEVANRLAPEHLELLTDEPFGMLGRVENAGAVFLGPYSSEPLGDYYAGPNHVLPTGGTARFFSPLGISEYIKKSSVISYTAKALEKVKDDIMLFARAEGLEGHANAIGIRFER
jgi:histidinol dehydrogenase